MTTVSDQDAATTEAQPAERAAELLGGPKVLRQPVRSALDAHALLSRGLPGEALRRLTESLSVLPRSDVLEKGVGMSLRTFQRHNETPRPLSPEQSGRAWTFADILAKATAVFGSQEEAERWLERPAIGLNQQRPIDLFGSPAGVSLIEEFLARLKYGVYT
jgi:putative toxin-antitoxin system antitoxin component (TIGR02293 family)